MPESSWERAEQPILDAIARAEEAGVDMFTAPWTDEVPHLSKDQRMKVLARLEAAGYIDARLQTGDGGIMSVHVNGLTERGLRATGLWPSDDALNTLLDVLDARIAATDSDDERSKLKKFRDDVYGMGFGVAGALVTETVKRIIGLT